MSPIDPGNPKNPSIQSTSSATGAVLLIAQQFGSRALTFAVNQVLLRYLSPELLGISTQLEVYSITVLFFARESLRVAIQRHADTPDSPSPLAVTKQQKETVQTHSKKHSNLQTPVQPVSGVQLSDLTSISSSISGHVDVTTSADRTQEIVNLSYISIGLGTVFAFCIAWLYMWSLSVGAATVLETPYFSEALKLYGLAAFLELLAEPCYVVVQHKSWFGIRTTAELCANVLRCLFTCGLAIWAAKTGRDVGVLPFAIGQCTYAISLLIVFYLRVSAITSRAAFSLSLRPILSRNHNRYLLSYFPRELLKLAGSFFGQSILKHLLTQGDTIIIAAFTSPRAQGIYALANNYGGLVARLILQPIEEISRSTFGKILGTSDGPPSRTRVLQVRKNLMVLLRSYLILSVCIVSIGPTIAPLLLKLVAGARWTSSGAGDVLSTYCYYIPLLAINGMTEAFVSSVATKSEIGHQTAWMFAFSAGFAGAAVILLKLLDLGAKGLVCANGINMLLRISWSIVFIQSYLKRFDAVIDITELLPTPLSIAAGAGTYTLLARMKLGFDGGLVDIIKSGIAAAILILLLSISERTHILRCIQNLRESHSHA